MKQFKNILVIVGEQSDPLKNPALARAAQLAADNDAKLTVMDVITIPEHAINQYKGIIEEAELTQHLIDKRKQQLEQAVEGLPDNINASIKIAVGRDFIEIIREMVFAEHDLLIKVANPHSDSFDSSDFHIMRKCPKPVWLLKSNNKDSEYRRVLAAIDLAQEETEEGQQLNAAIMNMATSLAQWDSSQLDVLSCWTLYGESSLRNSGFLRVSYLEIEKLLKQEKHRNQQKLDNLINQYQANTTIGKHLLKGNPVDCIPNFAEDNDIDVVVMGTVGRTGIPGLLIGNTSETILHKINSSVVTLKPDNFESPVK